MSELYQSIGNLGTCMAQKGIGRVFQAYRGRHGRQALVASRLCVLRALLQLYVAGVDLKRKAQVGQRVFMGAEHQGLVRKCGELGK